VKEAQDVEAVRSEAIRALYKQSAMLAEAEKKAADTQQERSKYLQALEKQAQLLEEAEQRAKENELQAKEATFQMEIEKGKAVEAAESIRMDVLEDLSLVRTELARVRKESLEQSSLISRAKVKARAAEALMSVRLGAMEIRVAVKEGEVADLRSQVESLEQQLDQKDKREWTDVIQSALNALGGSGKKGGKKEDVTEEDVPDGPDALKQVEEAARKRNIRLERQIADLRYDLSEARKRESEAVGRALAAQTKAQRNEEAWAEAEEELEEVRKAAGVLMGVEVPAALGDTAPPKTASAKQREKAIAADAESQDLATLLVDNAPSADKVEAPPAAATREEAAHKAGKAAKPHVSWWRRIFARGSG